jgi:hypothetical protein
MISADNRLRAGPAPLTLMSSGGKRRSEDYTATDRFHTTFVYDRASDSWQWHMDNESSGVRRPFARVTLTRR